MDNRTVALFDTPLRNTSTPAGATCAGASKVHSKYGPSGANWYGLAQLGGCEVGKGCTNTWFSTPADGECAAGAPLGTDGCSWRVVEVRKYANATCVDSRADAAVVAHGKKCFDKCPQPLNKNTDCWLDCYRNTLMGDPAQNLSAVDPQQIIAPWKLAFAEDDPAKGGCPHVTPTTGPMVSTTALE